jgi:hypothetical protein
VTVWHALYRFVPPTQGLHGRIFKQNSLAHGMANAALTISCEGSVA